MSDIDDSDRRGLSDRAVGDSYAVDAGIGPRRAGVLDGPGAFAIIVFRPDLDRVFRSISQAADVCS